LDGLSNLMANHHVVLEEGAANVHAAQSAERCA
jgi:hypothetical protein